MERMKDSFCNYGILGGLKPGPNFVQSGFWRFLI